MAALLKRKRFDTALRIMYKDFDYVIRRLTALLTGLKKLVKGLTFAATPLSAISRFKLEPQSPEARPLFNAALAKMGPCSARIWSSQPQMKGHL